MELSKHDSKMLKGVAIIGLLMLHLFCRKGNLPYQPFFYLGNTPLVYYFGLFGDICVPIFCFISGYAAWLSCSSGKRSRWKGLLKFLISYWVVLILFSLIGLLVHNDTIPGDFKTFVMSALTWDNSYNGAWWYANTFVLLVALQPLFYRFVKNCPTAVTLLVGMFIYTCGYGLRFLGWLDNLTSDIYIYICEKTACLATSIFPYLIGMLFCKLRLVSKLRERCAVLKKFVVAIASAAVLLLMIAMHGVFQTNYVAVFTAVATICLFCVFPLPNCGKSVLCFLGDHSGNIWLVHMFFYVVLFENFVFCAKYPTLIFLLILAISLLASFIIKLICRTIFRVISL